MALRVWLPLNGSLENIGVSDIVFTNSNTSFITVDSNGKIGKCYTFNSTANNNGISSADNGFMNKYINNKSWSICAWIKTTSTDTCVISLSYGLRMFAGDSTHTLISLYNSSRTVSCTSPTAVNDGNWHHLAATYDINTNMINFYIDGINVKSTAYTSGYTYASSWTNGLFIGKDPNNSTVNDHYLYKGSLNDIRIYDHCLSAKEVKEITQGLVLHYKLDNIYNGFPKIWSLDSYSKTADLTTSNTYIYSIPTKTVYLTPGKQYTVGTEVRVNQDNISFYFDSNCTDEDGVYSGNDAAQTVQYNPSVALQKNEWIPVWITTTIKADAGKPYYHHGFLFKTTSGTATTLCEIRNIQIYEGAEKLQARPFDVNDIITDSSGYGNDGIAVNSPQIVFDENSRYNICTQFNGSNTYINAGTAAKIKDAITIAWWGYMNSWSSYTRAISCTEGGGWNFEPSSGKLNFAMGTGASSNTYKSCTSNTTLASLSAGWHHFVGTYDGLVSNLYIDGVLDKTLTCYSTKTPIYYHASNSILVGAEAGGGSTPANNYFNGKLSDIRIYATALSAEDILDLYHIPANVDNLGGMHGFEFNEIQTSTLSDFTLSSNNWVADGATATYGNDSKIGPIVTIVPSSGNRRIYHNVTNVWTTGTTYLVSFLAKSSAAGTITPSRSLVDNGPVFSTTTDWKQYYGLITSTATPGGGTLSLTCAGTNTYYIANVKLELANQNLISILENGSVQENWLDENNFQSHASFLKTSSNIIANNFIEK